MNDSDLTPKTNISRNQKTTGSSQDIKEQVKDAGAELKQRASEALRATSHGAQEAYQGATDAAKDLASEAKDKLEDQARQQQQTGAEYVNKFAGNIREAARAFEKDAPFAARGITSVAEYVEEAAEKIRQGSFRDLVDNATDFAKPFIFNNNRKSLFLFLQRNEITQVRHKKRKYNPPFFVS